MGKLRTAITDVQHRLAANEEKITQLAETNKANSKQVLAVANTAKEGWDAIYLYLVAKFKKAGSTVADNHDKSLKDVLDQELVTLIKGLEQYRKDLLNLSHKAATDFATGVQAIRSEITAIDTKTKEIRGIAEKKKAKWFASKQYKTKIKGYLSTIDDVEALVKKQSASMDKAKNRAQDDKWVNRNFQVTPAMTVQDIADNNSRTTELAVEDYIKNSEEQDAYVRQWRDEYKGIAGQLATMKKWSDEADEMETTE